jgi:hypothetical protein
MCHHPIPVSCNSNLLIADMPARLPPLMHPANRFNQPRFDGAVETDRHRLADRRFAAFGSAVTDVKAADACVQIAAIHGRQARGIGRDPPQRRRQERPIADLHLDPMLCFADRQQRADIGLRGFGKPITRPPGST